jgi:flagellar biosynthesis protein FlhB
MGQDQSGEKTEQPTQKKLDESKKKGQIWKSKELTSAVVLLTATGALGFTGPMMVSILRESLTAMFALAVRPYQPGLEAEALYAGLFVFAKAILPFLGVVVIIAGITEAVQAQGVFSAEAVMPKLEKLDPIKGLKNLFSTKQLVELLKSIGKFGIAAWATYSVLKHEIMTLVVMSRTDIKMSAAATATLAGRIAVRVGLLYMGIAVIDTVYQWRRFIKDMMMTKDEVKQEYKQSEGDPHHKAARKQLHQEILQQEQMQQVRNSDVVVTNPDHIAVAIKYDKEKDNAPRVVAKGQRVMAEQIKAIAKEAGVPIMRNVPLAHALLRVDIGDEIPEELYDTVAEVLNWVFSLSQGEGAPKSEV